MTISSSVSVWQFGAAGDAKYLGPAGQWYRDAAHTSPATDDTAAFNSALAYASTNKIGRVDVMGGSFLISSITVPAGVCLDGGGAYHGAVGAQLVTNGGGKMVTLATSANYTTGGGAINSIGLTGYTAIASTQSVGIYASGSGASITNCALRNFNNQGIWLDTGSIACTIMSCLVTNGVMNKMVASLTGAVQISGTDHYVYGVEAGCGQNVNWTISSASLYCTGIAVVAGGNLFMESSSGENADVGITVDINSYYCRFVNCRGDNNSGHGWSVAGKYGVYSACAANNNGQASNATYQHYNITAGNNTFLGCVTWNDSGHQTNRPAYGFADNVSGSQVNARNAFVGCNPSGYVTAPYLVSAYLGSSPILDNRPMRDATTTPDVTGSNFVVLTQGGITITNFIGGFGGRVINVLALGAGIIIENSSSLITSTKANKTLSSNGLYRFTYYNGTWYEDADFSILTGTAAPTSAPLYIGQVFLDTTNRKEYRSFGNSSLADWVAIN